MKSDTESSSSEDGSGDERGKKAEPSGFFLLQHRNQQENLKQLTEAKLKARCDFHPHALGRCRRGRFECGNSVATLNFTQLTEETKKLRQENETLFVNLNRANNMSKTQVNILKAAQLKQVGGRSRLRGSDAGSWRTRSSWRNRCSRPCRRRTASSRAGTPRHRGCGRWSSRSRSSRTTSGLHRRLAPSRVTRRSAQFEKAESCEGQLKLLQDDYDQLVAKSNQTIAELEVGRMRCAPAGQHRAGSQCQAQGAARPDPSRSPSLLRSARLRRPVTPCR